MVPNLGGIPPWGNLSFLGENFIYENFTQSVNRFLSTCLFSKFRV